MDMDSVVEATTGGSTQVNRDDKGTQQTESSEGRLASAEEPTLEQEVKQLVGSVSSWWTDFSKRSQEQITAARKEIESQGGIVSIAKKEALRFETQLNEAQKAARERAQGSTTFEEDDKGDDTGKGKQKAATVAAVEGDDGVAVEMLEEKKSSKSRSNSRSEPLMTSTGEAIFDVDGDMTQDERAAMDHTIQTAKQNAQTALHNVQSFWDRLQADPRLSNIQASLANTLKNVSVPLPIDTAGASTGGEVAPSKTLPTSFADVSKQFQTSFPHLNWKESQGLAKKYFDASENVARDWGKEMTALMGDLIKIVPPEEQSPTVPLPEEETVKGSAASLPSRTMTEEEDFDWDGDMDANSASTGLQTTSAPETTSWESGSSELVIEDAKGPATTPTTTTATATTTSSSTKEAGKSSKDDDEDSDWE